MFISFQIENHSIFSLCQKSDAPKVPIVLMVLIHLHIQAHIPLKVQAIFSFKVPLEHFLIVEDN